MLWLCYRMLINLGLFLAIWITSSFAEQSSSGDAVSAKTMVFQDMLGKKDPPSPERDELFKKTLMVSQVREPSEINKKKLQLQLISIFKKYLDDYRMYEIKRIRSLPILTIIFWTTLISGHRWDFRVCEGKRSISYLIFPRISTSAMITAEGDQWGFRV